MDKFLSILGIAAKVGAGIAIPGVGGQIVTGALGMLAQAKEQFDIEARNLGLTPEQLEAQVLADLRQQLPQTRQNILDRMAETREGQPQG